MLKINNLKVRVDGKRIIDGISLNLKKGKIYALMGPNGSGKSTLALTIMGHPKYKIEGGEIVFGGENLNETKTDERAKMGIFLSFQHPQEIEGLEIRKFLGKAKKSIGSNQPILSFTRELEKNCESLEMKKEFLGRYLNHGFSGGEKKKSEMLQLITLDPQLAIIDEIDSGLDIDALRSVAEGIRKFMTPEKTILIVTHYKRILEYIVPDEVIVMKNGKIAKSGGKELIEDIEDKGYKKI
jgi:Fe-S cluster assembly ATP-binding protein